MKNYLALLLTFLTVNGLAQYKLVTIDARTNFPNEPSIYINPVNPAQIVAGSNIHNVYVSNDSGKNWNHRVLYSTLGVYGDPVVYCDEYGNFYFCHLSATPGKKFPHWIDRIVVQKSDDGGLNFSNGSFAGFNGTKEQDKHWITKDDHSMLFKDNIYLSWTEFDTYESKKPDDHSRIRFARSVDGAQTFETAITISDTIGDCLDGDHTLEGATPAVLKNGEVCIAWAGHGNLYFDKSSDGGVTWGKDRIIARQNDGWALDFNYIYRSNGLPFLVADNSRGRFANRLYLVWGEKNEQTGGDVKLIWSGDGGNTWSEPISVHTDSKGDQFMPHIAVDQKDGTVYIVYYDRSRYPSGALCDVSVAVSTDGGNSFINRTITSAPFVCPGKQIFFGDYNGIAAHGGMVRPIWTGTQSAQGMKTTIESALLTKEELLTKSQVVSDSVITHLFRDGRKGTFVIYSGTPRTYEVKIIYKKHKWSIFKKTRISKGSLNPAEGRYEASVVVPAASWHKINVNFSGIIGY